MTSSAKRSPSQDLLTAADVVAQLKPMMPADLVMLPRVMFDWSGERTIDDWSLERIEAELGTHVVLGRDPSDLTKAIRSLVRGPRTQPMETASMVDACRCLIMNEIKQLEWFCTSDDAETEPE